MFVSVPPQNTTECNAKWVSHDLRYGGTYMYDDRNFPEAASQAVRNIQEGDGNHYRRYVIPVIAFILLAVVAYLLKLVAGDFLAGIHNYVKTPEKREMIVNIIIFLCFATIAVKLFLVRNSSTFEKKVWGVASIFSLIDLVVFPCLARALGQANQTSEDNSMLYTVLGLISWLCSLSGFIAASLVVMRKNSIADSENIILGDNVMRTAKNRVAASKMLEAANVEATTEMWRAAAEIADVENEKLKEAGVTGFVWTPELVYRRMLAAAKSKNEQDSESVEEGTQKVYRYRTS